MTTPYGTIRRRAACIILAAALPLTAVAADLDFSDGFEAGTRTDGGGWVWGTHSNNVYVTADPVTGAETIPYQGQYSLAFAHRAKPSGEDSTAQQRFKLDAPASEIWMSYKVRVPDNFYHRTQDSPANNKWMAIWTDAYEGAGVTVVLEYWPDGNGGSRLAYRWVRDKDRKPGHQDYTQFITVPDMRGKWMTFQMHLKLASALDANDGVIETWVQMEGDASPRLIHRRTDAPLYTPGFSGGFVEGYMMGWSNSGFAEDTTFYVDNFQVSGSPGLANVTDEAPPKPPAALQAE